MSYLGKALNMKYKNQINKQTRNTAQAGTWKFQKTISNFFQEMKEELASVE